MKKIVIIAILFVATSCGKSSLVNPTSNKCEDTAAEYLKAIEVWSADIENKSKCEAVKKSLTSILKECSIYTAVQKKVYEDQLKEFTCE
jgi:maltose-binding protein MalE